MYAKVFEKVLAGYNSLPWTSIFGVVPTLYDFFNRFVFNLISSVRVSADNEPVSNTESSQPILILGW